MSVFSEINEEQEKKEQEQGKDVPTELPEAFQVLHAVKTAGLNGKGAIREEIVDTFMVDRATGVIPDEKAKNKAKAMKRVFPDKTFYVVGIYKRIIATY